MLYRRTPNQSDTDRRNDTRLATPLLIMAVVIALGILVTVYTGHPLV